MDQDYRGFQESDIREGLRAGERLRSAIIIVRPAANPTDMRYVAYLRTSWRVGYHLFQQYRYKGERVYQNLGRLVFLLQVEFRVEAPIQLFVQGSLDLWRFRNLLPLDKSAAVNTSSGRVARIHRRPRSPGAQDDEQARSATPPFSSEQPPRHPDQLLEHESEDPENPDATASDSKGPAEN